MPNTPTNTPANPLANPPSPRRCHRILQAHHLRCQGRSLRQIAAELGCAHPTVSAYLRDLQLHRSHILHTVAADRLLDQVHLLTQPESDPAQHRQHVAAARELRLLLRDLPQLHELDEQQREQLVAARNAPAIAIARTLHYAAASDGHARYIGGPMLGRCLSDCPMCRPELFEGESALAPVTLSLTHNEPTEPEPTEPDDDLPPQITSEPDPIRQNLTKSDHPSDEFPAPDTEFDELPENSLPQVNFGPQHPASWDNPFGYIPRQGAEIPLVRQLFGQNPFGSRQ